MANPNERHPMRMNDGLSPKYPWPTAGGPVRVRRNRQGSGHTAESPCQSAVDRQNSAADGVGQIGPKSLIYKGYPASRGRISTAEKRFLPAAGRIATGPAVVPGGQRLQ